MKQLFILLLCLSTATLCVQSQTRVLFIGDSITDGNWGNSGGTAKPSAERSHWDMNHIYGSGYMYLCATHFQGHYPEQEYDFFNRGISGNTLNDLKNRWQQDVIEIKPDVLSILIGTNDVSQFLDKNETGATFDLAAWEATYRSLIEQAKAENPDVKLMICAPFVANTGNMKKSDNYATRQAMVSECATIVKQIAKEYQATYVPFDELFAALHTNFPTLKDGYWIWDGIHPTPAGHKRMADLWIEQFQ